MDNNEKFLEFREKYKDFYYNNYNIYESDDEIIMEFEFEVPGLVKFNPKSSILKKNFKFKNIDSEYVKNMVFHIGLIELISYWKATCSSNVIIKCGNINEDQINWFKKLYFNGLGELFYRNNIKTNINDFMNIIPNKEIDEFNYETINEDYNGYIVPIGGGKDSVVTLETLNIDKEKDYALIINPKEVTIKCALLSGLKETNIIEVYRSIDNNLLDLNSKGFINGHTPFSSMLAFYSYLISYLLNKKYIALSNENSANESNIIGEKINHQYSKSFEFECDFEYYSDKYLKAPVKYFSFLRPLNELQIAKIFSRKEKYHSVFKSCNVGSKGSKWYWCCDCAKCLFAFIILSPYLYEEKLVSIFGEDLFKKESLLQTFIELTGNALVKPFDCVGTFEEVNFAISKTIENMNGKKLPYLLDYYKNNYKLVDTKIDITKRYNLENNLNKEQDELLRKEVFIDD